MKNLFFYIIGAALVVALLAIFSFLVVCALPFCTLVLLVDMACHKGDITLLRHFKKRSNDSKTRKRRGRVQTSPFRIP